MSDRNAGRSWVAMALVLVLLVAVFSSPIRARRYGPGDTSNFLRRNYSTCPKGRVPTAIECQSHAMRQKAFRVEQGVRNRRRSSSRPGRHLASASSPLLPRPAFSPGVLVKPLRC